MKVLGLSALLSLMSLPALAAGETLPSFGLSPGASPNTVCIFDLSATRPCVTMGTLDSVAHAYTSTPLSLYWTKNVVFNGSVLYGPQYGNPGLGYFFGSMTGTCSNGGQACPLVDIETTMQVTKKAGDPGPDATILYLGATVGGPNQKGTAINLDMNMKIASPTGNGPGTNYGPLRAQVQAVTPDGGVPGTPQSAIFGANFSCGMLTGATDWNGCTAQENDLTVATGATVQDLVGVAVVLTSANQVAPQRIGAAFNAGTQPGALPTFTYGLNFSGPGGYSGLSPTATVIGCAPHIGFSHCIDATAGQNYTIANGVDFSTLAFTGSAFKSTGFSVDGTGIVTGASYKAGATAGVTCSGSPTASFASTGGIVTHC